MQLKRPWLSLPLVFAFTLSHATAQPATPLNPQTTPAATPTRVPLAGTKTRFYELVHQLVGWEAAMQTLPATAFTTAFNSPKEWGRTWKGTGKRAASTYGQLVVGQMIEFGVGTLHHEDPRYFRMGATGTVGQRTRHVLKSVWVTPRSDGSGSTIALGKISSAYGSYYIGTLWSPPSSQGAWKVVGWGSFGMVTKTGVNALREFWPDVKGRYIVKKSKPPQP